MELYFKVQDDFEKVASALCEQLDPKIKMQERDGLNLGGGQYFLYLVGDIKIILCKNQGEVKAIEMPGFPYYLYVYGGQDKELERFEAPLKNLGYIFEYGDYVT